MNGLERALEIKADAHLLQSEIGLLGQEGSELALVGGHNEGLAPRTVMLRGNIAGVPTLLNELLYHTQGNSKAVGNLLSRSLAVVIRI
jgi:hypothetical protein